MAEYNLTIPISNPSQGEKTALNLKVENMAVAKYINSIVTVDKEGCITETGAAVLETYAAKSGDKSTLENCDFTPEEKLGMANANEFNKYYDLSLSADKKFILVKIKDNFTTTRSGFIIHDFGLKENVLLDNNRELMTKRPCSYSAGKNGKNRNFNNVIFKADDVIKIPVDLAKINTPRSDIYRKLHNFLFWNNPG